MQDGPSDEDERIKDHNPTLATLDASALRVLLTEDDLDPITRNAAKKRLAMLSDD